ncbi:MAG: mevalonate kinase [Chloroflexi bacterium]|nr:mevalonate kinase [Chloroflexota bacterium]
MKTASASAPGKIILFGEHAVVYGRPAIAVPLAAVRATATVTPETGATLTAITIEARDLGLRFVLDDAPADDPLAAIARATLAALGRPDLTGLSIVVTSTIPAASGLGSSAAVNTAIVRALAASLDRRITPSEISALVYETEKMHHGTPSGIDNTVVANERPVYFVKGQPIETFEVGRPFHLVVGDTGVPGSTKVAVSGVRERHAVNPQTYDSIFDDIGGIVARARVAIESGDVSALGPLMNQNHALLQQIDVSSPELDRLVEAARSAGAFGAKMSGGGMGGNMIAVVSPEAEEAVRRAMQAARARRVWSTIVEYTNGAMSDEFKDAPEYMDYARRALRTARLAFDDGDWVAAINRAYYAIFYAANAALELEGLERSKHSHVLSLLRQRYVKTGMVEVEYSDIYGQAFAARNESDYERTKFPETQEAEKAIDGAGRFVQRIDKLLSEINEKRMAEHGDSSAADISE